MHWTNALPGRMLDAMRRGHEIPGSAAPQIVGPTPASARTSGIALALAGSLSNQTGAALGAKAFPVIGVPGVVVVRQFVTAAVLLPLARPRLTRLHAGDWLRCTLLAVMFAVMNLALYLSVQRIGLGLAVTLEFLGPLAVAIGGSRRGRDLTGAGLATVGVVALTRPGPATDWLGIALALLAGAAWGTYILLNRSLGRRLPGLTGPAVASLISALAWAPVALYWFGFHLPRHASDGQGGSAAAQFADPAFHRALLLALACGLGSSAIVYAVDLLALRRMPANAFGVLTSVNPVWAALAGWVLLGQGLHAAEWTGIALIVASNVLITWPARRTASLPRPRTHDRPGHPVGLDQEVRS